MDIKTIIADLKMKEKTLAGETARLEDIVKNLRAQLSASETTLGQHKDDLAAIKMSIESLEMVGSGRIETPRSQEPVFVTAKEEQPHKPPVINTRRAKKIGKFNVKGEKIGEWASINKCAHDIGWTNTGVSKYIETVSPEKQIKLRGYYMKYVA